MKKVIIHGNIPGSISFQKYQRCRWKLRNFDENNDDEVEVNSEMKWDQFRHLYQTNSQPMMLNRTVESLSSSVELIGEENNRVGGSSGGGGGGGGGGKERVPGGENEGLSELAMTDLYGAPGLVFEVMKNNTVSSLTIY